MKRIFLVFAILSGLAPVLSQAQSSATSTLISKSGLAIGIGYDYAGYGITARWNALSLLITDRDWANAVSADYIILNQPLPGYKDFEWYAGAGVSYFSWKDSYFINTTYEPSISIKGNAGVAWTPPGPWEVYIQGSPSFWLGDFQSGFNIMYSSGFRYRL